MLTIPKEKEVRLPQNQLSPCEAKAGGSSSKAANIKGKLEMSAQSMQSIVDKTTVMTEVADFETLSIFHSRNGDEDVIFLDEI